MDQVRSCLSSIRLGNGSHPLLNLLPQLQGKRGWLTGTLESAASGWLQRFETVCEWSANIWTLGDRVQQFVNGLQQNATTGRGQGPPQTAQTL